MFLRCPFYLDIPGYTEWSNAGPMCDRKIKARQGFTTSSLYKPRIRSEQLRRAVHDTEHAGNEVIYCFRCIASFKPLCYSVVSSERAFVLRLCCGIYSVTVCVLLSVYFSHQFIYCKMWLKPSAHSVNNVGTLIPYISSCTALLHQQMPSRNCIVFFPSSEHSIRASHFLPEPHQNRLLI